MNEKAFFITDIHFKVFQTIMRERLAILSYVHLISIVQNVFVCFNTTIVCFNTKPLKMFFVCLTTLLGNHILTMCPCKLGECMHCECNSHLSVMKVVVCSVQWHKIIHTIFVAITINQFKPAAV